MVCSSKLAAMWQFVYDTNRPAFLERDLVGVGMNGHWKVWVRFGGGEAVSIHAVRKGTVGFSNVKSITYSTLKLVDYVHGFAIIMGSNGESEVGARAGGMMNGDKSCIGVYRRAGNQWGWQLCGSGDWCSQ